MSDGLIPSVGSPPGQPTPVGVQPGTTPGIVLARYVIIFGANGGVFLYSGTPAFGNPPIAWITLATADPYKNPVQPGIFLAELASSGNALGGLLWNTVVGSEPLLALFPDSTLGFTGNSPFILGRVLNRGLASESVTLALGGGGASGTGSPVMLELFGLSKDGTTTPNQIIAYYPLYIEPPDGNTYRAGHQIFNATATTINNTTGITITGLSANVGIGSYFIRCKLRCVAAGSGTAQVMAPRLSGTATPSGTPWRVFTNEYAEVSGTTVNPGNISGFNVDPGVLPGAIANGQVFDWEIEGIISFSAAGTLLIQGRQVTSASDETFTVQAGSFMELFPA